MTRRRSSEPLRILLVDAHAIVRVGLRNLVNDELDMRVVSTLPAAAAAPAFLRL